AGFARALLDVANYLRGQTQGHLKEREALYEQGLAIYRKIGHKKGEANALNNIAGVVEEWGDLPGARRRYEESLAIRRLINDRPGMGTALNNIGTVFQLQGDLAGAERSYERAL